MNTEEKLEQETLEEVRECDGCEGMTNYPAFNCKPEKKNLQLGIEQASYLVGFIGAINSLRLSEQTLATILMNKMALEYQQEMLRMQLESEERVAEIYSKSPYGIQRSTDE